MLRNFCLYCGTSFHPDVQGASRLCHCSAVAELLEDLEQQERVDVAEYKAARWLEGDDLRRNVWVQGKAVRLADLLAQLAYKDANAACPPRATETELLQLVYLRRKGSRLFKWVFCATG